MPDVAQSLRQAIAATPVIDPHCHLRAGRPAADSLADLVLYHHVWVELVSSGMPVTATSQAGLPHELADPAMAPLDRVRAALPYLPNIRNTTCGSLLRCLLRDLYDVPEGELTDANVDQIADAVTHRASDPTWGTKLLRERCHITKALTVEDADEEPCCGGVGKGAEGVPILLAGKEGPAAALAGIEARLGREVETGDEYVEAMQELGRHYGRSSLHFAGVWVPPFLDWHEPRSSEMEYLLYHARQNEPLSESDIGLFAGLGLRSFLAGMREGNLRTIQLIVGAQVLPPHRSITQWHPRLPETLARLAAEFEDFHFNCSTASDLHTQDLAILAKHVPNISVAGYWWHTLYPATIRKSLELRLDIVPANKIVAFFSDAYHAEWVYPKLQLVQRLFGDVLLERVADGTYTEDLALSLVAQVFHDSAARIYGVTD